MCVGGGIAGGPAIVAEGAACYILDILKTWLSTRLSALQNLLRRKMVVKVVRCGHFALIRSEVVVVKAKRASRQSIKVCFFSAMESDAVNSFSEVLRSSPLIQVSWALWNGPLSLGLPLRPTGKSCESSEQLSKNGLSHGHAENSQFHLG